MKRLKVLMIAPQYRPLVGGYERAAERLSAALVSNGHAVTVVAERRSRAWPRQEFSDGVRLVRLSCVFRPGLHILTALANLTGFLLFQGRRYDAWHVHQYGAVAAVTILLGKLYRRPVLLKLTSSARKGIANSMDGGLRGLFMKALHRRVDAIIALSRETAAEASNFGIPKDRIHLLGNGVDTDKFRPRGEPEKGELRQKLGLSTGSRVVVCVGRLEPDKNLEGLLKAWSLARKTLGPHWLLVVIGDGSLKESVCAGARDSDVAESILVKGLQANIDEWMGASDIYVSSSDREGLSNTLLEAMACGLPVAVTRVSGVQELVADPGSGIDVPVGDMEGLGAALARLGESSALRESMGEIGRSVIESRYSIASVASRHEALYRTLIASERHP